MARNDKQDVARLVLLRGLQTWGQTVEEQIKAWQNAYDFMGLSVKLGVGKKSGRKAFTFDGADAETAKAFMTDVRQQFPIGSFEAERAMIENCLDKYRK